MTDDNLPELTNLQQHYPSLNDLQHEQLIALRNENHDLRSRLTHCKERYTYKKKQMEELQVLVNDAGIRLNEGSDLIRKLQQHLKICQDKLSDKTKDVVAKDDTLREYQSHIDHLNDIIRRLMDDKRQLIEECTAQQLQLSLNVNDKPKMDVSTQTLPTTSHGTRSVRFNLDKENCPIDSKYFPSMK